MQPGVTTMSTPTFTQLDIANAYFSVNSDNVFVRQQTAIRRAEFAMWEDIYFTSATPASENDWDEYAASLRAKLGVGKKLIGDNLLVMETLEVLPGFRELVVELGHVDLYTLRQIITTTTCDTFWDFEQVPGLVDELLGDLYCPTRPNQSLPSIRTVKKRITELLRNVTPEEGQEVETETGPPGHWVEENANGTCTVSSTWDAWTTAKIEALIHKCATENNISFAAAHALLILEDTQLSLILNMYQASDVADAPVWMSPFGDFNSVDSARAAAEATHVRDLSGAQDESTDSYRPTSRIKAYVEGRDGTCRFPGCTRPAMYTDKDHRVDHADGGPTSPHNLISLCRHHHNKKTDGSIGYLLDGYSGAVYWLYKDGTWEVDEPTGPLSPKKGQLAGHIQRHHPGTQTNTRAEKATGHHPTRDGPRPPTFLAEAAINVARSCAQYRSF